ncbi:hypothetical protein BpHYR1_022066, partial [Brachionus plicatilis]
TKFISSKLNNTAPNQRNKIKNNTIEPGIRSQIQSKEHFEAGFYKIIRIISKALKETVETLSRMKLLVQGVQFLHGSSTLTDIIIVLHHKKN